MWGGGGGKCVNGVFNSFEGVRVVVVVGGRRGGGKSVKAYLRVCVRRVVGGRCVNGVFEGCVRGGGGGNV